LQLFPAASAKAVTVGASTLGDERAYFSNHGKCIDIFAPGLNILSTYKEVQQPQVTTTLNNATTDRGVTEGSRGTGKYQQPLNGPGRGDDETKASSHTVMHVARAPRALFSR